MKIFIKILLLFFTALALIFLYFFLVIDKQAIGESTKFYKNRINQAFVDSTTGCLDICLSKSYTKLDSNAKNLAVFKDTGYAKDNRYVFYKTGEKVNADPYTLEVINTDLAKDKEGYILRTQRLHEYIYTEVNKEYKFEPNSIEVKAYSPYNTITIQVGGKFYNINLHGDPKSIEEVFYNEKLRKYFK